MKFYIFLITLIIHQVSFGQDDNKATIIFNDDTKLEGIGEIKKNTIYFKISAEDKYTEWSHDYAKGIIFSGYGYSEKYEYTKLDNNSDPIIMEIVDDGFVKLYRKNKTVLKMSGDNQSIFKPFSGGNFLYEDMSTTYYVKRNEEDFATNISSSFKTRSLKYFSDCKSLIEKIYNRTFTVDKIKEMIEYYNNYCDGEEN